MLAQSSDWAFIMTTGTMVEYAQKRTLSHVERFDELVDMVRLGTIDEMRLAEIEALDNLFADMDFRIYCK